VLDLIPNGYIISRDALLLDQFHQQPIRSRPLEFSLVRAHFPPRPGPPGPAPPSSSGGAGAMATIPMSYKTVPGVGRGINERTNDDHKGKDVNPIFLDETLLWFGRDDLAFGSKRWG
jgi:hypothetical protein